MPSGIVLTDDERFWLFVDKNGRVNKDMSQCWSWLGSKIKGYGAFKVNRRNFLAHRYSYQLHHPLTDDIKNIKLCVCHKCDNSECTNPEHFFLGTIKDNNDDKEKKGRQFAKLTEAQVLEIRHKYANENITYVELAKEYGVCDRHIGHIVKNERWTHI